MKLTRRLLRPFSSVLKYKLEHYAGLQPSSLSMQNYIEIGRKETATSSFVFVRNELLVRLANIMKEMTFLPKKLLNMPSVRSVSDLYYQSFDELLHYENADVDFSMVNKFNDQLERIMKRHNDVVKTMAAGLLEFNSAGGVSVAREHCIQYFLDRFYTNRISKRMLQNQHLVVFGSMPPKSPHHIGYIDPSCDVANVIKMAFSDARYLCDVHYKASPALHLKCINSMKPGKMIRVVAVPSHLYHVMFELFKNAMRATVEFHPDSDSDELPPIKVTVVSARHDLSVKVSDRGGGFPRSNLGRMFNFMYSTAPSPVLRNDAEPAMAGYGYGLPLSRLYARYFLGDLMLSPLEGYGTDAHVYMKATPFEAAEVLPIYCNSSRQLLTTSIETNDWSHHLPEYGFPSK
uniref:Protein-serine/threonine kinase n=1 Tax=Steinernema glaseri TaxID=37863 RepID=A0A1I7ZLR0_9BILA